MTSNGQNPNGWNEWSKHVLLELERLNKCYQRLDDKMNDMAKQTAVLQAKAGMLGAGAGAGGAGLITLILKLLGS